MLSRRSVILGLAAVGIGAAQKAAADVAVIGGHAFGSSWRLTTGTGVDSAAVSNEVGAIIAEIDGAMSPYRQSSDVSRFNTTVETGWQAMPRSLCEVAAAALNIAHETGGAFDPTVGPLVSRYGFGPITGVAGRFSDIEARGAVLRKGEAGLTLDLCGIAKGYALDRIASRLRLLGLTDALIEVGGETRAIGLHPSGRGWRVAIADPTTPDFKVHRVVDPVALALATSGRAVNGVVAPIATSHIINPVTQTPAQTTILSVTVLAPTAMRADALATALCAAGLAAGIALAQRLDVSALFITDGSVAPIEVLTGDFSRHLLI